MGEQLIEGTAKFDNSSQTLPGASPMDLMGRNSHAIVEGIRKDTGSYKLHSVPIDGMPENYAVEPGRRIHAEPDAARAVSTKARESGTAVGTEAAEAGAAAGMAAGQAGKLEENKAYPSSGGCPIKDSDGQILTKKGWRSSDGVEEGKPLQGDPDEMKQGGESALDYLRKFQNKSVKEAPDQPSLQKKKNYVPDEDVPEQKK